VEAEEPPHAARDSAIVPAIAAAINFLFMVILLLFSCSPVFCAAQPECSGFCFHERSFLSLIIAANRRLGNKKSRSLRRTKPCFPFFLPTKKPTPFKKTAFPSCPLEIRHFLQ
jgi:hypothetical protein